MPCTGGLSRLVLSYTGGGIIVSVAAQDDGGSLSASLLSSTITINSRTTGQPFQGNVVVSVTKVSLPLNLVDTQTFGTSCSPPTYEGTVKGNFVVLSGASLGGPLCCSPDDMSDIPAPTISGCPGPRTGTITSGCTVPVTWTPPTATAFCGEAATITSTHNSGHAFGPGVTTVTYTARDRYGNTSTCSFAVTVTDPIDPVISCPASRNEPANSTCQFVIPDYRGLATASDNCVGVTVTQFPAPGTVLSGEGTTQNITLTATDNAGNTGACVFTVTVTDQSDPAITCPGDQTAVADLNCEYVLPDYRPLAVASDNCDGALTITQSPAPSTVVSGITAVTITVTDNGGNDLSCSFNVIPEDNIPPVIPVCQPDVSRSVNASCNYVLEDFAAAIAVTDNCTAPGNLIYTQLPVAGTVLSGIGSVHTITFTAMDEEGNSVSCDFDITLEDTTAPSIACPGNRDVTADLDGEFVIPDYTNLATATDNCDNALSITQSPAIGTVLSGAGTTQVITLTATDDAGNSNSCTFTIRLIDTTAPQITCPANRDVATDAVCDFAIPDYTGLAIATDNADNALTITQSPAIGTVLSDAGTTQIITLTATDDSGNATSCTFTLRLTDTTAPQISCPANRDVATDAACDFAIPDYTGLATATDNCDNALTITQSPAVGTVLSDVGTTQIITLTATDDAGNVNSCTFTIRLIDATAPQITCPANRDVVTDANCDFAVPDYTGLAAASDNCDNALTITQSPAVGTVLSDAGTTQVITLTATDDAGNSNSCTFTIRLTDTTVPQISCPADRDVATDPNCDFSIPDYTGLATVTDNCDNALTITQSPAVGTVLRDAGTTQVITLTATDDAGNSNSCTFTIRLIDTTAPQITCPADRDVATDPTCDFTVPDYTNLATVTDNCDDALTITQSPAVGTVLSDAGTTQVITLTATDDAGNTNSCTFTIRLIDTTAPQISCSGDRDVATDPSCDFTVPDYTNLATATDNCDHALTITQSPVIGTVLSDAGTTQIITLTATDDAGNSNSCTFTIRLTDTTAPQITCPADRDVATDATCDFAIPDYTGLATATDNCDNTLTITQSPAIGTVLSDAGTTQTITLTATDDSGNASSCTFTIRLIDTTAPQISCPANRDVVTDANCDFAVPDYTGLAVATDNCDSNLTITQSPAVGTVLSDAGTTQVITLTATDDAGNSNSCTFTIRLTDTTAPQITCPANRDVATDPNCDFSIPDYTGLATVTDNCDNALTITQSPAIGTVLRDAGTIQVITLTATDDAGNSNSCTFTIRLIDTTAPQITCPADRDVVTDPTCDFTVPDYTNLAAVTDNCDDALTITQSPAVGTVLSDAGTTQVITLTATDDAGNANSCTFTIRLIDTTAPQISCPANRDVATDASCDFAIPDYTGLAPATDNCDNTLTITQSPAIGTVLSDAGTTQVITLTATDDAGNTNSCTFTIRLIDTTPPQITCPANRDVATDASCDFAIPDYTGLATATDHCDNALAITQSPAIGTVLSDAGTTQVITLTATDDAGNSNSCTFTIRLVDSTAPQITCPANRDVVTDANCDFAVPDYTGLAVATDNCDSNITITQSPAIGTVLSDAGTTQIITLTATDDAGNSNSCTFTVRLIDTTAPQITCPANRDVATDLNCKFSIPDYTGLATPTDNCDNTLTITQSPAIGTVLSDAGTTQVITLTATDDAGNSNSCTFTIRLIDTTAPQITCPADRDVVTDPTCDFTVPDYTNLATVTDNCDDVLTITQSPAIGTVLSDAGTTQIITLTATDDAGNSNSCTFTIRLIDTTAPQITCPADRDVTPDVNCDFALPDYTGLATATDNCDNTLTITQSPAIGTVLTDVGTTQAITLTATDHAGNATSCTFTLRFTDTTPPQITCPANFDVAADAGCDFRMPDYTGLATATDNCGNTPTVTQSPASGTTLSNPGATQVITLTARDGAGNTASCTFTIRLIDTIAPQITCPGNRNVAADANCGFALPDYSGLATVADNCDNAVTITQSPAPGTVLTGAGTLQMITLTATDDAGNASTCTFTVTVEDQAGPVFTRCPSDVNVMATSSCAAVATWPIPVAIDNCGTVASFTSDHDPGEAFPIGVTPVRYTATDSQGHMSYCEFNVIVANQNEPIITGCPKDITAYTDESGQTDVDWTEPTATTTCGTVTLTRSHEPGAIFSLGTTTVEYKAADLAGNVSTCTFDITVQYEELKFDIARIVTPDGDGINDYWALNNIEKFRHNKVLIVDRWGSVVYSASGYNNESVVWNGVNTSGVVVPTGTYFYTISVQFGVHSMEKRGFIEVIR